jgi:hypothetical protein
MIIMIIIILIITIINRNNTRDVSTSSFLVICDTNLKPEGNYVGEPECTMLYYTILYHDMIFCVLLYYTKLFFAI